MITTYEEFLELLNEKGFMLFSGNRGYISLGQVTRPEAWHTDGELDPWEWKDRLSENRDGAYAHIFAGQGSLISREWYPIIYAAYCRDIEDDYAAGLVPRLAIDMWRLFDERPSWGRHELRAALGGRYEKKGEFDGALRTLENGMLITISGQIQPLSLSGSPMGWQAMEYTRVDSYLGDWLNGAEHNVALARQMLRTRAFENCPNMSEADFKRCFGKI